MKRGFGVGVGAALFALYMGFCGHVNNVKQIERPEIIRPKNDISHYITAIMNSDDHRTLLEKTGDNPDILELILQNSEQYPEAAAKIIEDGRALYYQKDFASAIKILEVVADNWDEKLFASYAQVINPTVSASVEALTTIFSKLSSGIFYAMVAHAYQQQGNIHAELRFFEKVKGTPLCARHQFELFRRNEKYMKRGVTTNMMMKGLKLLQEKKYDDALPYFLEAQKLFPENPDPYTWIGVLYATQGKFDQAIQWYERSLMMQPEDYLTQAKLLRAYLRIGFVGKGEEPRIDEQLVEELRKKTTWNIILNQAKVVSAVTLSEKSKTIADYVLNL